MKQYLTIITLLFFVIASAQMNNKQLEDLLNKKADTVVGTSGKWQVTYNEIPMMIITDEANDRMRIISPITELSTVNEDMLLDCLVANFHTALDVKYAMSNDIIWAVFIHPLSPLSEGEVISAIEQLYYASINFGTTYTSTPLLFGGRNSEKPEEKEKEKPKIKLKKT